jgi:hypothetical protein
METYYQDIIKKEEDIGNVVELEPDVFWYERQRGILGRPDLVPRISLRGIALFVLAVIW